MMPTPTKTVIRSNRQRIGSSVLLDSLRVDIAFDHTPQSLENSNNSEENEGNMRVASGAQDYGDQMERRLSRDKLKQKGGEFSFSKRNKSNYDEQRHENSHNDIDRR